MCALEIASERKDDFSNQVQLRKEVMNGGSRDAAEVYLFYLKQSRPSAKTTCNNSFGRSKFPLLSSIRVVTLKPYHYSNDKLAIFLLIRVSKEKRNNDSWRFAFRMCMEERMQWVDGDLKNLLWHAVWCQVDKACVCEALESNCYVFVCKPLHNLCSKEMFFCWEE